MKLTNSDYFAQSIIRVLGMMCNLPVKCGEPRVLSEGSPTADVSGIITFSGDLVGAVVLTFPEDVGQKIVKRFAEAPPDMQSPEFLDAIGELTNMVAGQAKSRYKGFEVSISIPTVVCGPCHHINRQRRAPWVVLPCECEHGSFILAMSLIEAVK